MGGLIALSVVAAICLLVMIVLGIKYYGNKDTITKSTEEEDRVTRIKVRVDVENGRRLVRDLTAALDAVESDGDEAPDAHYKSVQFYPDEGRIIWFDVY